jgi:hypothetical protein
VDFVSNPASVALATIGYFWIIGRANVEGWMLAILLAVSRTTDHPVSMCNSEPRSGALSPKLVAYTAIGLNHIYRHSEKEF